MHFFRNGLFSHIELSPDLSWSLQVLDGISLDIKVGSNLPPTVSICPLHVGPKDPWHHLLVGGLEPWNFMTFHILGITIPTDELICFRGVGIPPTSLQSLRLAKELELWAAQVGVQTRFIRPFVKLIPCIDAVELRGCGKSSFLSTFLRLVELEVQDFRYEMTYVNLCYLIEVCIFGHSTWT